MEIKNRKSISGKLSTFDYLISKDSADDFIEVTEWTNEEGWDISTGDGKVLSISEGLLDAINYLTKKLEYEG